MIPVALRASALAGLVLTTLAAGPAPSPPPHGMTMGPDIHVTTDQSNFNFESGNFTMPTHVTFTRPGTVADGDRAHGNSKQGMVVINGHVVVHDSGNAPEAAQAGAQPGGGPSTLTCDELQIDTHRQVYIAIGNVHYTQGPRSATAQRGELDQLTHTLDLTGDVHMTDGDQTLTAETVHYDTVTKNVTTSQTRMSLPATAGTTSTLPTPRPKTTPKHA